MLLDNRDTQFKIMEDTEMKNFILVKLAVLDLEFAKQLGLDDVPLDIWYDGINFDVYDEADLFMEYTIEQGTFNYLAFLADIANNKDKDAALLAVTRYVKKLVAKGYSCDQMMREMANDTDYTSNYEIEAEGILMACPDNDWSWLPEYFKQIGNEVLEDWWNNRADV